MCARDGTEQHGPARQASGREHLVGLRGTGRAPQRRVGRLLVHGLSPRRGRAHEDRGAEPVREGGSSPGGAAHAALVYDGARCVGWCQFGPPDELPRIKRRRAYLDGLIALPDWRITCFFVDREYRRSGVAATALTGALDEIARLAGGTVESYPEDTEGRSVSGSFLNNGTVSMFESHGFERTRRLGKHHWVVTRVVGSPSAVADRARSRVRGEDVGNGSAAEDGGADRLDGER